MYKNDTVEISDMFPAAPEDFEFPDPMPNFEFPDPMPNFEFWQNEMGYIVTSITDQNNNYSPSISIDDMTYDGVKPEENPHVEQVFFDRSS